MVVVRGDYRGDGGVGEVESAEWSRETPTTKTLKSRSSMSGVVVRVVAIDQLASIADGTSNGGDPR